jgi:hypothetical protein
MSPILTVALGAWGVNTASIISKKIGVYSSMTASVIAISPKTAPLPPPTAVPGPEPPAVLFY